VPVSEIGHPEKAAISLAINGETRQSGDLNQMIWKVAETISYLSSLFELQPGDLIFTGTPAGVGPVKRGDRLEGKVDGVATLTVTVV
jgi:fumarylpyruvate hydrolase